jgi:hypothetical protein
MKRSPLTRKTPLKSNGGGLKQTPLKPRSAKTAKRYREERIPFVQRILGERPLCEACPTLSDTVRPSVDVHEILSRGRSGGVHGSAWLRDDNVLALCRPCHTWITENPAKAEELGFSKPTLTQDD